MRRPLALAAVAGMILAATPALAGGGYHYGHYKHRHHHHHGGRYGGAVVVGALVGGLILGHLLTRPAYTAPRYREPVYVAPPPAPVLGNCRATTGTSYLYGRPALYGGVMCFDRYGRGYIQPGSTHFIGYLN